MSLKVYELRIGLPKPSLFARAWKSTEELPLGAKILAGSAVAAGAVALAPVEGAVAVGAAGAAGVVALAAGLVAVFGGENEAPVQIISEADELAKFTEGSGDSFANGAYYIAHPKKPQTLFLSSKFHKSILLEQIGEIIAFLRSKLLVTSLRIEVKSAREGRAEVTIPGAAGSGVGGDINYTQTSGIFYENVYRSPELIPIASTPIWLDRFQTIINAVQGARAGASKFQDRQDLSFNMKVSVAERIGVEAIWMTAQSFTIWVEYGTDT